MGRWAFALIAAAIAITCGMTMAWADDDVDSFAEVSDSSVDAQADDQEATGSGAEAEVVDEGAIADSNAASEDSLQEHPEATDGEDTAQLNEDDDRDDSASEAMNLEDANGNDEGSSSPSETTTADDLAGEFSEDEFTVEVGKLVLVGFAPSEADADSDEEERVKWYEDWHSLIDANGIDVDSDASWLVSEDAEGGAVDYDGITGIVTSDKEVFELFGEFPEWKVDNQGVEYRWWYGLLGNAKKAGDVELSIVYRQADGTNLVADECTVHVVEPEEAASQASGSENEVKSDDAAQKADDNVSDARDIDTAKAETQDTDDDDLTIDEENDDLSSVSAGKASSMTISTQATESSNSASSSSSADTETNANADQQVTNSADAAAYPKRMCTTASGSKIAGALFVNDSASEAAFQNLGSGSNLSLVIEAKDKLGDTAETQLTSAASSAGLQVGERLSIKVTDANGSEVAVSGMNLTVQIALDAAIKALDASSVQVYYIAENGAAEKMEAKVENGYLNIGTTHLSDYVVLGKRAVSSNTNSSGASANTSSSTGSSAKGGLPQTGDDALLIAVPLAFVAGFAASSALNARRRMKEISFDFEK